MSPIGFGGGIERAYQITTVDDCILRQAVTDLCLFNHWAISRDGTLNSIINKHEPAAWRIACQVGKAYVYREEKIIKAVVVDAAVTDTACGDCGLVWTADDVELNYEHGLKCHVWISCSNCEEHLYQWKTDGERCS